MRTRIANRWIRRATAVLAMTLMPAAVNAQTEGAEHTHPNPEATTSPCPMHGTMGSEMMSGNMGGTMMMQGRMSGMNMMMGMHSGKVAMQAMRYQPHHILSQSENLELTADQVAQIESLANPRLMHNQDVGSTEAALERAFESDPDTAAVRSAAHMLVNQVGTMHVEMLVTGAAVRNMLTADQRNTVDSMRGRMMSSKCQGMKMKSTGTGTADHQQHHPGREPESRR